MLKKVARVFIVLPLSLHAHDPYYWSNWGRNQECIPRNIYTPSTLDEMCRYIRAAHGENKSIRFCGSGHSWSDLVCTNGCLINTDKFNRVLEIDHAAMTIKVEGGIKIKELVRYLAQQNLALSNQGFITEQSIAGAIATATHGTGRNSCLSDFVIAVELIDAQGNLHTISATSHPEWLPLVRVHLGALGFIYTVTLQCEPLFILEHKRFTSTVHQILRNYQNFYNNNDYFMFMAPPYSDCSLVYLWNRTRALPTRNFLIKAPELIVFSSFGTYAASHCVKSFPRFSNNYLHALFFKALGQKNHRDYCYKLFSPYCRPMEMERDYIESEIAVPLDCFAEAFLKVRALFARYRDSGATLVAMITCRFCAAQTASYLGLSYGRDSAYINVTLLNHFKEYESFFREFQQSMSQYKGRAHWGKFNYLTKEYIEQVYDHEIIEQFNALRRLLDPRGMFANDFIKRCFQN